ncbi:carboxypeptidase-like regulatory domain-containing protein [Hymenobacter jeollabukensis]|nr:carboxypeptidase-like regulatory domain-containing protein [Hymenobacter jeollabukensis]
MQLLFVLCLSLLLSMPLLAQRTIVGRVTDRFTGEGIPGVTVMQCRSDNATSTATDGTFSLKCMPADSTSISLSFSSIGYITAEQLVVTTDSVRVALSGGTRCNLAPDAIIELVSGLRHTPFGGRLQVYGYRFSLPMRATIGYQTDFRRNFQQHLQLEWLGLHVSRLGTFDIGIRQQAVRNTPSALQFRSHSLTVEADFYHRLPVLLLGVGRARIIDERSTGFGYEGGIRHYFQPSRLTLQLTATRWPGYWQWQGEISRNVQRLRVALLLNAVDQYAQLSASLGYSLY